MTAAKTMTVRRVRTSTGSRIEPPLDQHWSELRRLQWKAAVVTTDTAAHVTVSQASTQEQSLIGRLRPVRGHYNAHYRRPDGTRAMTGLGGYRDAWAWLNGFRAAFPTSDGDPS